MPTLLEYACQAIFKPHFGLSTDAALIYKSPLAAIPCSGIEQFCMTGRRSMTPQITAQAPRTYDTFHMGRSGMDLYSNDVGAAFVDIKSFAAYVGGSSNQHERRLPPAGIDLGAPDRLRRGPRRRLRRSFSHERRGRHPFQPPEARPQDRRRRPRHRAARQIPPGLLPDNCADIVLSIDDVLAAPITESRVFQFAGTNLSQEPSRSATLYAAEIAHKAGTTVVLDLDFRPDQWHDPRAFGTAVRSSPPRRSHPGHRRRDQRRDADRSAVRPTHPLPGE